MTGQAAVSGTGGGSPISRRELVYLGGVLLLCLLVHLFFLDRVAGLFSDDAWYALLAKSIATGQGYQLINSPTPGILPLYPPFYPLLLSLPFRLFPDFPQNVYALKAVSILAMMGLGVVSFFYFKAYRNLSTRLALILVALILLCQPLMFLATSSLMSECLFALEAMAMFMLTAKLIRGERERGGGNIDWFTVLLLAGVASAVFLTRTIAFVLVGGVLASLLKERLFREFAVVAILFGLVTGIWTLQTRARIPTPEQRLEQGGNIVMNYREQFWQKVAGVGAGEPDTLGDLPGRIGENLKIIVDTGVLYICAPPVLRLLSNSETGSLSLASIPQLIISLALIALVIIGYIGTVRRGVTAAEIGLPLLLGLIIVWPFRPLRFLAPLAPFIFFYLFAGLNFLLPRLRSRVADQISGDSITAVAAVFLLVSLLGHGWTAYNRQGASSLAYSWDDSFQDNEKLMAWISKNIPQSEVVISNNPALLTLFTGHRSVSMDMSPARWDFFRRAGLRYVVLHRHDGNNAWFPGGTTVVHRLKNQPDFRVIDLGPPESRVPYTP